MSAVGETLADLREVFAAAGVPWFVFSAQAVAVRAVPRATQDIVITIEVERAALRDVVERLDAAGFAHRYPEIADDLLRTGSVVPLVHRRTGMEVDLVVAGSGLERLAFAGATAAMIDGVETPVASSTHLAVMKTLAARGKDLDDLRALLASGTVDVAEAQELLEQLEEALGQSDLVPAFVRALEDVRRA
jgi:hypothetical protein